MANTKSAIKAARQAERRRKRNVAFKNRLKKHLRALEVVKPGEDKEAARAAALAYISLVDKGVKTGRIHRNKAARIKSRLAPLVHRHQWKSAAAPESAAEAAPGAQG
jgi:small subunit ribosomal protein S20